MAWIKLNSETNTKVGTLPQAGYSTNGSICVLETLYGDIEYMFVENVWVPIRALTDITIYISEDTGVDAVYNRGSLAAPFASLMFALTLIPKKIKNLNIHILRMSETIAHDAYGKFENFIGTEPNNFISITGTTYSLQEAGFTCSAASLIFDDNYVKIDLTGLIEYSSYEIVYSGAISAFGVDVDTGLQYVTVANTDIATMGIEFAQGVQNNNGGGLTFIYDIEQVGSDVKIYLLNSVFTAVGQVMNVFKASGELQFIKCTSSSDTNKIGTVWPVLSVHPSAIVVPKAPTKDPISGDVFEGCSLPAGTFDFINTSLNISIDKVLCTNHSMAEYGVPCFKNCNGFITFNQSTVNNLFTYNSPNLLIFRSNVYGTPTLINSFSVSPDHLESSLITEITDLNYVPDIKIDSNNIIISSIVSIDSLSLYKSSLSLRHTTVRNRKINPGEYFIGLLGAYIQADDTSTLVSAETEEATYYDIYSVNNSTIDIPVETPMARKGYKNPIHIQPGSGMYRESNYRLYANRDDLLSDITISDGIIASVITEPGNIYLRQSGKWIPATGNRYTTENMPTSTDFTLPVGLELFNLTLGREITWT